MTARRWAAAAAALPLLLAARPASIPASQTAVHDTQKCTTGGVTYEWDVTWSGLTADKYGVVRSAVDSNIHIDTNVAPASFFFSYTVASFGVDGKDGHHHADHVSPTVLFRNHGVNPRNPVAGLPSKKTHVDLWVSTEGEHGDCLMRSYPPKVYS